VFFAIAGISGQVAYRICAIRELFEETGILLARRKDDVNNSSGSDYSSVYTLSDDEIQAWQKKVHENSYNFIAMCKLVLSYSILLLI
jgi:nucleoside diphosphate-linked moiety X motif protein 19